jgi:hypothetical protein
MFFALEVPNKPPLKSIEFIKVLEELAAKGDPHVRVRVQFRTIAKQRLQGPHFSYSHYAFRPPRNYFRTEGLASEILKQFRVIQNGERHEIHPKNGEIINAARIYSSGPMGIRIDHLRYPPRKD